MNKDLKHIRISILLFIFFLVISGLTAFPVRSELDFLMLHKHQFPGFVQNWIITLHTLIDQTPEVVLYGTDWLAFAHLVIAMFFIGVYIDPLKHKFNVLVGIIACFAIFPLAFIMGPLRGIPFFHQLIDCSFGVFGAIPLYIIYKKINRIENESKQINY